MARINGADVVEAPETAKAPAFQFYPKDFLGDGNQAGMSLQESGAYARLMCFEWNAHGKGLPDDVERCARMVGATLGAMRKMWPALRSLFAPHPSEPGRLVHPRLEQERRKQAEFKRRQSDKGKASAANRAATGGQPESNRKATERQPEGQPEVNSSSSVFDLRSSDPDLKTVSSEALTRSEPAVLAFPVIGTHGTAWALTEPQLVEWGRLYPGVDVMAECRKALAWVQANERKTAKGMPKFLVRWLNRAVDSGRVSAPSNVGGVPGTRTAALQRATAGFLGSGS